MKKLWKYLNRAKEALFERSEEKSWSIQEQGWVEYTRIGFIYFYKVSCFQVKTRYLIRFKKIQPFSVFIPPVIYTLEEIKEKYPNYWTIPTSPEIWVKWKNKYYKLSEIRQLY